MKAQTYKKYAAPPMGKAEMMLEIMLDLLGRLADVSTGDREERAMGVICHTLRGASFAYARSSYMISISASFVS